MQGGLDDIPMSFVAMGLFRGVNSSRRASLTQWLREQGGRGVPPYSA